MKQQRKKMVSIIIPAYNEDGNIKIIADSISNILANSNYEYEIIFVDDGSTDDTFVHLINLSKKNHHIKFISFSRNFGHQAALKAGLDFATGNAVISLDADMQHPPELIPEMLKKWEEGYEVVYTQRNDDENLPFLKRITSKAFYKTINLFSDIKLEPGTSDFRLLDEKVVSILKEMPEHNLFYRGFIKWVGFNQFRIVYQPGERNSGKSKYSLKKMISLALNGVTSMSIFPLRIATYTGFIISIAVFAYSLLVLYDYFFTNENLSGWTTIVIAILFLGGTQLITLGILGEYLGKLFFQAKGRPKYIVKDTNITEG